jgi:small redox-active disulfide protein 2
VHVKILGPGCANCHTLEKHTREALDRIGLPADVETVTDVAAIAGYGVMRTPGLVVDETVLLSGRVPSVDEIAELLAVRRLPAPPPSP